jgi:hypothetical protein
VLVFPSEALISDLIVAERAYAADRWGQSWGQPLTYDFGRRVAWLSFPRWKQHGLVGTRSRTRSRAIRRRMSQKGANSKQEKLMARASAPKEQERVAEAAKRSVETCSALQRRTRGSASLPAPAERLGPIISTVHTNDSTLSTGLQLAVEDPN